MRSRLVGLASIISLAVAVSVVPHAAAADPEYRPDSFVKKGGTSVDPLDYLGYLVYNANAAQTMNGRVRAGRTASYTFVARQEGTATDNLYVHGCETDGPVTITWLKDIGGSYEDVTADIIGNGMILTGIGQNVGVGFLMKAKVKRNFSGRGVFMCSLYTSSELASLLIDDLSRVKLTVIGH